ncbi:MAG: DNA-formamidopyrimidine glycosylase family protein [Planctomycetota bacterium]
MPEGDTLFRTAFNLRPVLAGRTIVAATTRELLIDADQLTDKTVTEVRSRGKHLLLHLNDGGAIHSHMGMTGSWHIYPTGARWQKPKRQASLVLETDQSHTIVCFTPKMIEVLSKDGLRRHAWLNQLGPDILDDDFCVEDAVTRFAINGGMPVGVAIMDQRLVCGIGNVYKSEVLFLERINPFASVSTLTDDQIFRVIETSRHLMKSNLLGYPRRTRFRSDGPRKWVYGRSGESCFTCGQLITMRRQGDLARSTYYCGNCQDVS